MEVEDGEAAAWHLSSVRFTVENSAVRVGKSRKMPAPALAEPEKKEIPAKSCAEKPVAKVRAMEGTPAWNGRAVMVVLSLGRG